MGKLLDLTSRLNEREKSKSLDSTILQKTPKVSASTKSKTPQRPQLASSKAEVTKAAPTNKKTKMAKLKESLLPDFKQLMKNDRDSKRAASSEQISEKFVSKVLDMTHAREEIINSERRQVKRTILTEFIGAFVVLPERGLYRVSLYDISQKGIAFDINIDQGKYQLGDEIAMRVYLNHKTYFKFIVKVSNVRVFADENIIRHGANYMKGTINDVALDHFVKFIETVSASLKTDDGDILVSHIS